jgi:hypothetical protein
MLLPSIHLYFGMLLVATAAVAIFWPAARRIVQYVLGVQILLGIGMLFSHYRVTPVHWILALVAGALWGVAAAFERRGRSRVLVIGACVLAVVILAYVFHLGQSSMAGAAL